MYYSISKPKRYLRWQRRRAPLLPGLVSLPPAAKLSEPPPRPALLAPAPVLTQGGSAPPYRLNIIFDLEMVSVIKDPAPLHKLY